MSTSVYGTHSTETVENKISPVEEVFFVLQNPEVNENEAKNALKRLSQKEKVELKELIEEDTTLPTTEALITAKKVLGVEEKIGFIISPEPTKPKSELEKKGGVPQPKFDLPLLPTLDATPTVTTNSSTVPLTITDPNLSRLFGGSKKEKSEKETMEEIRREGADFLYEFNRPKYLGLGGRLLSDADIYHADLEERRRREKESIESFKNMVVGGAKRVSQGYNPYAVDEYDYMTKAVHDWAGRHFKPGNDLITLGVDSRLAGAADIPGSLIEMVPNVFIMLANPDGASVRIGESIESERGKLYRVPRLIAWPGAAARVLSGTGDLQNGLTGTDTDGRNLTAEEIKDKVGSGGAGTLLLVAPAKGVVAPRFNRSIGRGALPKEATTLGDVVKKIEAARGKPVSLAEQTIISKRIGEIETILKENPNLTFEEAVARLNGNGVLLSGANSINKFVTKGGKPESLHVVLSNVLDSPELIHNFGKLKEMPAALRQEKILKVLKENYEIDPTSSAVTKFVQAASDSIAVTDSIPFKRYRSISLDESAGLNPEAIQKLVDNKAGRGINSTATSVQDAAKFQLPEAGSTQGEMMIFEYPEGSKGFVVNGEGVVAETAKAIRENTPNGRPDQFVPNEMMLTRPMHGWDVASVRYENINGQNVPVVSLKPRGAYSLIQEGSQLINPPSNLAFPVKPVKKGLSLDELHLKLMELQNKAAKGGLKRTKGVDGNKVESDNLKGIIEYQTSAEKPIYSVRDINGPEKLFPNGTRGQLDQQLIVHLPGKDVPLNVELKGGSVKGPQVSRYESTGEKTVIVLKNEESIGPGALMKIKNAFGSFDKARGRVYIMDENQYAQFTSKGEITPGFIEFLTSRPGKGQLTSLTSQKEFEIIKTAERIPVN